MIEQTQAARLAAAINAMRPEWPAQSLLTFISKNLQHRAYRDAAIALAWIACDEKTLTPARVLEAGPWWQATAAQNPTLSTQTHRCPDHPAERAWDCRPCAEETTPVPSDWRDQVKAAIANPDQENE